MTIKKESELKNEGEKGTPFIKHKKIIDKGAWRTKEPHVNKEKCIKCYKCWLYCPDGAIEIDKDGFPKPNPKTCKGCAVCASLCPVHAIEMKSKTKVLDK